MSQVIPKNFYGVGVEWVRPIERETQAQLDRVSCVELTPENFFGGRSPEFVRALQESQKPVVIHGIELSVGSLEPIKQAHLDEMLAIADSVNTVYFSEHLSFSEADGVEIGELTPLHWTEEVCDFVSKKIETIQKQIPYPFMIENVANRFVIPENTMTEEAFINKVLDRTGCGLQLDITNLYTNSINFNFDAREWLSNINLSAVTGVQLAGGTYDQDGDLMDNHSTHVPEPVWKLFEAVCQKVIPNNTIVEWTDNFPPYSEILEDIEKARSVIASTLPATSRSEMGASL